VKLNSSIGLDDSETELDPQNPNPRGAHGTDKEEDSLDFIINSFNERWYQGWDATPEDQRVKFVNLAKNMETHPDFKNKYADNSDSQNREIAFNKIFNDVMAQQRKIELDLYKKVTQDDAFRIAMQDTLKRILSA
jgi:type I restriction enzyme R subunit